METPMKNQPILYGVIGLLAGVILTGFTASYAVNHNNTRITGMMGMHTVRTSNSDTGTSMMEENDGMGLSINGMMSGLSNKTGDNFDKAFLAEMIDHHQGAIDMANAAKNQAKHQEIKDMADRIISAQTSEISQMKAWQQQLGY